MLAERMDAPGMQAFMLNPALWLEDSLSPDCCGHIPGQRRPVREVFTQRDRAAARRWG